MQKLLLISAMSMALLAGCGDDNKPVSMADLPKENAISFSVHTEKFIAVDKAMVDVSVIKRGTDAAVLTQQVNQTTAEVLKLLHANPAVESKTTYFNTNPYYSPVPAAPDAPAAPPEWEVSQGIHVESTNPQVLSDLIATFQNKVQISAINYSLSNDAAMAAKQEMTSKALQAFRKRAKVIAKDMGAEHYRLINLNIQAWDDTPSTDYASPVAAMGNYMGDGAKPLTVQNNTAIPLVLDGGKNLYRLTVSGQVVVPSK